MKRKFVSLFLIAILLCTAFAVVMIGCNNTKVTYSVTVLLPDETTPAEGITVSWEQSGKSKGSAVTGEDGKAQIDLPSGNYAIALSGINEGLKYTSVTLSASMRNIVLSLEYEKVQYSAKVNDKDGNPAKGVTVVWMKNSAVSARVNTNDDGVASVELDFDEYTVSVVDNLPENNVYSGSLRATGTSPGVVFNLTQGTLKTYRVTVKTAGGLNYPNLAMQVYCGSQFVYAGETNEDGLFTFNLAPDRYDVQADLPEGYVAHSVVLTEDLREGELVMTSSVILSDAPSNMQYVIGDIIHDFKFTTAYDVDGSPKTYSIAELLQTKKAVIINNWGINCTWCVKEMPAMQEAYDKYKDDIELIALDNYMGGDSDSQIVAYRNSNGYTFPMIRDKVGFASRFSFSGWPTTVIIDRYGAIARIESGAITDSEIWGRLIERYIGTEYVQNFVPGAHESDSITTEVSKPDITLPADHYEKLGQVVNKFSSEDASVTWYGETEYELAWPFLFGTVEGVSAVDEVIYSSNTGKHNSLSILYATVNVKAGKVFTFEYFAETERDTDVLSFVWDGKIVKQISGNSNGWQTCYLYADIFDGEHTLGLTYIKDASVNEGKDNVYIRNVHFADVADIDESMDMYRCAGYGQTVEEAQNFPYYANVKIMEDGYYHVVLSDLQNSEFAGNDSSPMLFVNMLGATPWSRYSLSEWILGNNVNTGDYMIDCNFTVNGVTKDWREDLTKYLYTASASDIDSCLPVDKELHDLLVVFMSKVSGDKSHANEWLEVCYFYSHYGEGEPIGNPIIGLTEKTAISVTPGRYTVDLTRVMAPYPQQIYTFTPAESGVYLFESYIPSALSGQYLSQIWIYDEEHDSDHPLVFCGENRLARDGKNEHNFEAYIYMKQGHKYYFTLSFQMAGSGTYEFGFSRIGDSADILTACSWDYYWQLTDDKGNLINGYELAGAVEYEMDEDGYYHVLNADGTRGDFIYLDVKYPSTIGGFKSLQTLVDAFVKDPKEFTDLEFKTFDFTRALVYFSEQKGENEYYVTYGIADMTNQGSQYRDYTAVMKGYVEQALANTGKEEGFVKVNQEIVDILTIYIRIRGNMIMNNEIDPALSNEWLRFCWFYKHYDENNEF